MNVPVISLRYLFQTNKHIRGVMKMSIVYVARKCLSYVLRERTLDSIGMSNTGIYNTNMDNHSEKMVF